MKTENFIKNQLKKLPDIKVGDVVKVYQKIKEGDKERIQIFEGIVIANKHGVGVSGTITVRKVVEGVGVERIFPLHSPSISKIEPIRSGKVRRAKLYYLRYAKGKKARLKVKELALAVADEEPNVLEKPASKEETIKEVDSKQEVSK